uniref:Uncharacterized protein n=1 Tax=Octopus bimaculoides TaxID=37653 RepID=A0A0L8IA97_OCTBM
MISFAIVHRNNTIAAAGPIPCMLEEDGNASSVWKWSDQHLHFFLTRMLTRSPGNSTAKEKHQPYVVCTITASALVHLSKTVFESQFNPKPLSFFSL